MSVHDLPGRTVVGVGLWLFVLHLDGEPGERARWWAPDGPPVRVPIGLA